VQAHWRMRREKRLDRFRFMRRIQRERAVPVVFEPVAFGAARRHGQHGIEAIERLNRRFLVDAEDRGTLRRIEVQADDVRRLVSKAGSFERLYRSRRCGCSRRVATPVGPCVGHVQVLASERVDSGWRRSVGPCLPVENARFHLRRPESPLRSFVAPHSPASRSTSKRVFHLAMVAELQPTVAVTSAYEAPAASSSRARARVSLEGGSFVRGHD
jgi:hypothetical protein